MKWLHSLICGSLLPLTASAYVIGVNGEQWDVSLRSGTFNAVNTSHFLEQQTWWNDATEAKTFALAFAEALPNNLGYDFPLFAYDLTINSKDGSTTLDAISETLSGPVTRHPAANTEFGMWAYAQRVASVPEPGSLSLLSIGALGCGLLRRAHKYRLA